MKTDAETQPSSRRTAALLGGLVLALTLPGTGLKAQVPDITKSVLLSWPEPTQEQIVVGADSPTGPVWTPWPEPIFKRFGELCVAVPTTASQQFFKLVLGTQFFDDFSDTQQPFTNRNSYTNIYARPEHEVAVTNGILRVGGRGPMTWAGIALCPPSHPVTVKDFCLSLDIISWTTSSNNWSDCSLFARGRFSPNNAYWAGLILNRSTGVPGDLESRIMTASHTYWHGSRFNIQAHPPPYRLEFSGVGAKLRLRVLDLTTKGVIQEMTVTDATLAQGLCGLYVDMAENLAESHQVEVDNFYINGTKP